MRFLRPDLAWWLAGALLVAVLARPGLRRPYVAVSTLRWLRLPAYRASAVRRLPLVFLFASLVLISLALMDPALPFARREVRSRGLDIVVVLDLSSSMQEDMEPYRPFRGPAGPVVVNADGSLTVKATGKTRLQATKNAIKTFIGQRRDDRIGLVVFSDHAYVVSPLTFDYDYLARYVDLVDDRIVPGEGQTAIGEGLGLAAYLLSRQSTERLRGHQVIVVFTDGENNRGRDPTAALAEADAAGIRVHVVGVALDAEVLARPQVRQLRARVQELGGRVFNASSERDLLAASGAIDAMEKGSLVNRAYLRDEPVYEWFAVPALVCLGLAMGTRAIPYFLDRT